MTPMTSPRMTRYFVLGLIVGIIAVPSVLLQASGLLRSVRPVEGLWASGIIDKKLAAARAITRPKILLLGGSSVHYGYSAEQLQELTGWPAVNLGTQVGLGLPYLLHYCQKVVNTGDVIVLGLEFQQYEMSSKKRLATAPLIVQALYYDRSYYDSLPWLTRARFVSSLTASQWLEAFRSKRNPNFARSQAQTFFKDKKHRDPGTTNERGDETHNTNRVFSKGFRAQADLKRWKVEPEAVNALREFSLELSAKGAVRALAFPTIYSGATDPTQHESNCGRLREAVKSLHIPILGKPEDTIFGDGEIYDSANHPNAQGRRRLTGVLARNLLDSGLLKRKE